MVHGLQVDSSESMFPGRPRQENGGTEEATTSGCTTPRQQGDEDEPVSPSERNAPAYPMWGVDEQEDSVVRGEFIGVGSSSEGCGSSVFSLPDAAETAEDNSAMEAEEVDDMLVSDAEERQRGLAQG